MTKILQESRFNQIESKCNLKSIGLRNIYPFILFYTSIYLKLIIIVTKHMVPQKNFLTKAKPYSLLYSQYKIEL